MKAFFIFVLLLGLCLCADVRAQSLVSFRNNRYSVNDSLLKKNAGVQNLIAMLDTTELTSYTKANAIPKTVRSFYRDVTGEVLRMADTGGAYNCCCDKEEKLPDRQLIYLGRNEYMVLMSYMHGMGPRGALMVAIFRLEGKRITDFWAGNLSYFEQDPNSQKEIVKQLRQMIKDRELEGNLQDL